MLVIQTPGQTRRFQANIGRICQSFRHLTFIPFSTLVKLGLRKGKDTLHPESDLLSGNESKERVTMSNSNNNQINVPQAREAMDRFKMQAAQDEDVSAAY